MQPNDLLQCVLVALNYSFNSWQKAATYKVESKVRCQRSLMLMSVGEFFWASHIVVGYECHGHHQEKEGKFLRDRELAAFSPPLTPPPVL